MPGVFRFGVNQLEGHLGPAIANGLSSILLFGVPAHLPKDGRGSAADDPQTPVLLAVAKLRQLYPDLVIACDVRCFLCLVQKKLKLQLSELSVKRRITCL